MSLTTGRRPRGKPAVKRIPRPLEMGSAIIRTPTGKRYDVYFSCANCLRCSIWSMPGGKCPDCEGTHFIVWGLEEMPAEE